MNEHNEPFHKSKASLLEKLRFASVGLINTLVDFSLLNALIFIVHLPIMGANFISTFAAMCLSLVLNKHFVFQDKEPLSGKKFVLFVCITLASIWIVQAFIILLLTTVFADQLQTVSQALHDLSGFSKDFFVSNIAKVFATIGSLIWNYYFYKRLVFKKI